MSSLLTVRDLIKHLEQFGSERALIVDSDGDTWPVEEEMFQPWSEEPNAPIAIFIGLGELELSNKE